MKIFLYICVFSLCFASEATSLSAVTGLVESIGYTSSSETFISKHMREQIPHRDRKKFLRKVETAMDSDDSCSFMQICLSLHKNLDDDFLFSDRKIGFLSEILLAKEWILSDRNDSQKMCAVHVLILALTDINEDGSYLSQINLSVDKAQNLLSEAESYSDEYSDDSVAEF